MELSVSCGLFSQIRTKLRLKKGHKKGRNCSKAFPLYRLTAKYA